MSSFTTAPGRRHGTRWRRAAAPLAVGLALVAAMTVATTNNVFGFEARLAIISSNSTNNLDGFSFSSADIQAKDAGFGMAPVLQACPSGSTACNVTQTTAVGTPVITGVTTDNHSNQASPNSNGTGLIPQDVMAAVDQNPATKWFSGTSGSLSLTLTLSQPLKVSTYYITSASDVASYTGRAPTNWTLAGSSDGSNWTTVDTRTGAAVTTNNTKTAYTVTTPGLYTYYRWSVSAMKSGTDFEIDDFGLGGVAGINPSVSGSGAGTEPEAYEWGADGQTVFPDGTTASKYYIGTFVNPTNYMLEMTDPSTSALTPLAVTATGYTMTSGNDSAGTRDPKNWLFQGSNDNATWTTLDTQTNQSFAARNTAYPYPIPSANQAPYKYYRLQITAVASGSALQFDDLTLQTASNTTIIGQTPGVWKNVLRAGFSGATISGICLSKSETLPVVGDVTFTLRSPSSGAPITATNGIFDITDIAVDNSTSPVGTIQLKGNTQIGLSTADITTIGTNGQPGEPYQANPFGTTTDSTDGSPLDIWDPSLYQGSAPAAQADGTKHTFGGGWTGIDAGAADLQHIAGRLWQVQMTGNITLPNLSITVTSGQSQCAAWPASPYVNGNSYP